MLLVHKLGDKGVSGAYDACLSPWRHLPSCASSRNGHGACLPCWLRLQGQLCLNSLRGSAPPC